MDLRTRLGQDLPLPGIRIGLLQGREVRRKMRSLFERNEAVVREKEMDKTTSGLGRNDCYPIKLKIISYLFLCHLVLAMSSDHQFLFSGYFVYHYFIKICLIVNLNE